MKYNIKYVSRDKELYLSESISSTEIKDAVDVVNFLEGFAKEQKIAVDHPIIMCLKEHFHPENLTICVQVREAINAPKKYKFIKFPATKWAVECEHHGGYEHLKSAYGALMSYIKDRSFHIYGRPREYIDVGPMDTEDSTKWVTTLVIPAYKPKKK